MFIIFCVRYFGKFLSGNLTVLHFFDFSFSLVFFNVTEQSNHSLIYDIFCYIKNNRQNTGNENTIVNWEMIKILPVNLLYQKNSSFQESCDEKTETVTKSKKQHLFRAFFAL